MNWTSSGLKKTFAGNWEKAHSQEQFQEQSWEGESLQCTESSKKQEGWHVPGKKIGAGEVDPELGADGEIVDGWEKAEFWETPFVCFSAKENGKTRKNGPC